MLVLPHLKGLPAGNAGSNTFKSAALDLNFSTTKSLVDSVSGNNLVFFTRAGSAANAATYVGSDGVLRSAVTNLLLQSNGFDTTWTNTNSSETSSSDTAPDGTNTAWELKDTSDVSSVVHALNQTFSFTSGTAYTVSCWMKAGTLTEGGFTFPTAAFSFNLSARVSLSTGAVITTSAGVTASTQQFPNGWWRVSATATATATASAAMQLRIMNGGVAYIGTGTGTILLWGAQLEQSSTVGDYVPTVATINSAPRFDHNPTTGESLGLLVEEPRTNSIRNNTGVGAVAGTPGTSPTNWGVGTTNAELTSQIVGVGSESGISYIDIKISGTVTASRDLDIRLEQLLFASASSGQTWTQSVYLRQVGGSQSNIAAIYLQANTYTAVGTYVTTPWFSAVTVGSGSLIAQRLTATATLSGATTAYIAPFIKISTATTGAVDFTIRIGLPQLEQGAFATSVIPTTTATVTRAADVAQITGSSFSSFYNQTEGTIFVDVNSAPIATVIQTAYDINDGTTNERIFTRRLAAGTIGAAITDNNTVQANVGGFAIAASVRYRSSLAYKLNDFSGSVNGATNDTASSGTLPTVTAMNIGATQAGASQTNGTIRRLTFWPTRLANTTLQQITQP